MAEGANEKYRAYKSPILNELNGLGNGMVHILAAIPAGILAGINLGEHLADAGLTGEITDEMSKRFFQVQKVRHFAHGTKRIDFDEHEDITGSISERLCAMFGTLAEWTTFGASMVVAAPIGETMHLAGLGKSSGRRRRS